MFLKRQTFKDVKGFDTDYFMYGEDIDLSYKISKAGFQNYYLGTTSVIHFKGESTKKDVKYLKYFYKAMFIFYKKNLKQNFIFELFLELGMTLWFVIKYLQIKFSFYKKINTNKALYVGSDLKTFSKLKKHFKRYNFKVKTKLDGKYNGFIFIDLASNTFKNLIHILEQSKNKKCLFRMLLPNAKFVIGSDTASSKGEVVFLD